MKLKTKEERLSRLCIGPTHITHSHFLKKKNNPICSMCNVSLTVKPILLNCDSFKQTCPKYYQTSNLKLTYHKTSHTLLFNSFLFFLLFTFSIGMIGHHGLIQFTNLNGHISVEFFEILSMLQNSIQIFLKQTDSMDFKEKSNQVGEN